MRPSVNFIIDTNLIFYKFAFANAYKHKNYLTQPAHRSEMIKMVTKNVGQMVNQFRGYVDRVIFVADCKGKNWRKDIPVETEFYKEKRKKEYPFDIAYFNNMLDGYMRQLREVGIYAYQYDRLEGDDLMFMISNILFHNGLSSIISTSDKDMHQLMRRHPDGQFIYVFDPDAQKRHHYVPIPLTYLSENNNDEYGGIFSHGAALTSGVSSYNHIQDLIYQDAVQVDPYTVLASKIMAGDTSDSIPSAYIYMKGKNPKKGKPGKPTNFTEKRAFDLFEKWKSDDATFNAGNIVTGDYPYPMYPDKTWVSRLRTDLGFAHRIANDMIEEVKVKAEKGKNNDPNEIAKVVNNLLRNARFVHLSKTSFEDGKDIEGMDGTLGREMSKIYKDVKLRIGKDLSNKGFLMDHMAMFENGWPDDIFRGTEFDISEGEDFTMDFRDVTW